MCNLRAGSWPAPRLWGWGSPPKVATPRGVRFPLAGSPAPAGVSVAVVRCTLPHAFPGLLAAPLACRSSWSISPSRSGLLLLPVLLLHLVPASAPLEQHSGGAAGCGNGVRGRLGRALLAPVPVRGASGSAPDQGTYGVTSPHVPKPDEG